MSRMDVLTETEINSIIANSKLAKKYGQVIDRQSAYEILTQKISNAGQKSVETAHQQKQVKTSARSQNTPNPVMKIVTSPTFIRGVLGILSKVLR